MNALSEGDLAALRDLGAAVYPPEEAESWPGRTIRWASPQWGIMVEDEGQLVSYAGLLVRDGAHDGAAATIGGVGGVKTHPHHRGLGLAATAMKAAHDFFVSETDVAFALLVCDEGLLPYYGHLGWQPFNGTLLTEQDEGRVEFTFNRVMVKHVHRSPPLRGVIDLSGPPW